VTSPRHAILSVVFGPEAPRRLALAPGAALTVGSGKGAGLSLPRDEALGKVHFELAWDGARAELRAREGGATLLDGQPATVAEARHGSWIRAGASVFMLHHEAHTEAPARAPRTPASSARAEEAFAALSAERGLFGIVDAARSARIRVLLRESIDEGESLYEGVKGQALADVAPYLVRFEPGSRLLRALVEEGWGEAWGVYLAARIPMKELRRHLRHFLLVEDELRLERMYFRFYDPRTLRDFLPLTTPRQESELFGDVRAFLVEGREGELLRFEPSDKAKRRGDVPDP
jgi:Domain of unknown function (DUF4123)